MENQKIENSPAFPTMEHGYVMGSPVVNTYPGMTLRDYFAAKAMQGFTSACDSGGNWTAEDHGNEIAEMAYKVADAMLKARQL